MNGKNVYSGNINSAPGFVERKNNNTSNDSNQKYLATIISENLKKNSIEKPNNKIDAKEKDIQKIKNDRSKDKKPSKRSEELLKISVNYNDYDFNEFDKKIIDTYNPYGDDVNNAISNYEKIRRIMKQEERYERNFAKFSNNLDDIYDDIKEKITNETLKIIYGEDNFEYIPNKVESYRENWTTGDDEADLLLKIYHSPKIKQRDISAEDYIAQKYNEFVKTVDGKQSFEVEFAKTAVNPNDVVRVNLDKAFYMDDLSIEKNKIQQELYTRKIFEKNGGINKNTNINRFGSKSSTKPSGRPTPPNTPRPTNSPQISDGTNQNQFVPMTEGIEERVESNIDRVIPRRNEWISARHNEQLIERSSSAKKWELIEKLQNTKLEELIIENGLEIVNLQFDETKNKEILTFSSIVFDDEIKESLKIKTLQKFAKKNRWVLVINNDDDDTKKQTIIFEFDANISDSNTLDHNIDSINNFITNGEKITNVEELVENFNENNNDEKKNIENDQNTIENNKKHVVDNVNGIGGMVRMNSQFNFPIANNDRHLSNKTKHKAETFEISQNLQVKSLSEVLAEKRNKNHKQMHEARLNKKVSLKEAIDIYNDEHGTNHGPRKTKRG